MAEVKVTYDKSVDAAYVYLTEPYARVSSVLTYPCDPVDVDGMINLDFDEQGRLIGIEVLAPVRNYPSTCSSPRSGWTPKAREAIEYAAPSQLDDV